MMQTSEAQVHVQQDFKQRNIDILFKKDNGPMIDLVLRNIILLDSQSTMDLFCNPDLVNGIHKTRDEMTLQSNGGQMKVRHKAKISSYKHEVWFDKDVITI
jgi:hypothetical protein